MSKDEQEKRWMAYIDGQMSASEALDFERTLTARDRARLDGEVRLESTICDRLTGSSCCPAALWKDVTARMQQPAPSRTDRVMYWMSRTAVVLAAAVAILLSAPYVESLFSQRGGTPVSAVAIEETSREEFARGLSAGASYTEAETFLRENNINIHLAADVSNPPDGHRHHPEFLGVCRGKCPEGTLFELRFWCCNKPIKVLIARRGTGGERVLEGAFRCGDAAETVVGDYVATVVGDHPTSSVLRLLKPVKGSIV